MLFMLPNSGVLRTEICALILSTRVWTDLDGCTMFLFCFPLSERDILQYLYGKTALLEASSVKFAYVSVTISAVTFGGQERALYSWIWSNWLL